MQYTENYELPLIEGSDVIDYAPFNEAMGKIDNDLKTKEDEITEVSDDFTELQDNVNQSVERMNQSLEQTTEQLNQTLSDSIDEMQSYVQNNVSKKAEVILAQVFNIGYQEQSFGGESGVLRIPLNSLIKRKNYIDTTKVRITSNNTIEFMEPATSTNVPCYKATIRIPIISESADGTWNSQNNVMMRQRKVPSSGSSEVRDSIVKNMSQGEGYIELTTLITHGSNNETFEFDLLSDYTQYFNSGTGILIIEDTGMRNSN